MSDDLLPEMQTIEPTDSPISLAYLHQAILQLDGVCDGARQQDEVGFSGAHTFTGKRLARKIQNEEILSEDEINWCRVSLPYYFNTQLSWVDKETFEIACNLAMEAARLYRLKEEQWAKKVEMMPIEELRKLFMTINMNLVPFNKRRFIKSLQDWNYRFSEKQLYWIRKIVAEYKREN